MDVANIEAFLAVVRLRGFTRAANGLHLSQPALSRRIGLLEHELGQPVFERGRAGARLTDAGSAFLPHAQAALAAIRDGIAAVAALAAGESGRLTLAIVGTLASTDLTSRLRRFRDAHPHLHVQLRTGTSAEVSDLVRRGDATIGLRYFSDPAPEVASHVLHHEPLVVIAPPTHRLAALRRLQPTHLRQEPWVVFPARRGAVVDPFGQVVAKTLAAADLDDSPRVTIDSLTAQKRLVEAGFGLAMVPESSVREEVALQTLRALDVPALRAAVDVVLVHRKTAVLTPACRRLLDVLAAPPARPAAQPRRRRSRSTSTAGR